MDESIKKEFCNAGVILHDCWSEKTEGVNQCEVCGMRTLSSADSNKIPEGWKKSEGYTRHDASLIARWNIWIGICPNC